MVENATLKNYSVAAQIAYHFRPAYFRLRSADLRVAHEAEILENYPRMDQKRGYFSARWYEEMQPTCPKNTR